MTEFNRPKNFKEHVFEKQYGAFIYYLTDIALQK